MLHLHSHATILRDDDLYNLPLLFSRALIAELSERAFRHYRRCDWARAFILSRSRTPLISSYLFERDVSFYIYIIFRSWDKK